jgi:hypothetical protein
MMACPVNPPMGSAHCGHLRLAGLPGGKDLVGHGVDPLCRALADSTLA